MDFSQLWIGDLVFVKSLNSNAVWEGMHGSDKAKVKIGEKHVILELSELSEAIEENEKTPEIQFTDSPDITIFDDKVEIDLHIDTLNPGLINAAPQMILNHQIKRCRSFIENAIANKKGQILIIHGVGEGVLKSEIHHLLQDFDEVKFTFPKNNGGATEVWFN